MDVANMNYKGYPVCAIIQIELDPPPPFFFFFLSRLRAI
jgi:hypothetical protein